MRTNIFIVVIVTLVSTYFWLTFTKAEPDPTSIACTMEARVCPDGTAVGRTGPNCAFAPCPRSENEPRDTENIACTMDVMLCPDGTAVGRVAPTCEFSPCPNAPEIENDLIKVDAPRPYALVGSPIEIHGEARGTWFFEGSFPVTVVNWDGLIIGEGIATAQGEWMTEAFVPFTAIVSYTLSPDTPYDRGAVILKKDNPSGLPEHDNALEIPVTFGELSIQVQ